MFRLVFFLIGCHLSCAYLKLSITPMGRNIFVKENDDLNLTCRLSVPETMNNKVFHISWILPIKKTNADNRIFIHEGSNERTVTIHKLRASDNGEYICEVHGGDVIRMQKINIRVKTGKGMCLKPMFSCENGLCIPWNYVCDGYRDCADESDESFSNCGYDACKGKFMCDGRCISTKLCCDATIDPNCSANYLMPCCSRLFNTRLPLDMPIVGVDRNIPVQYKYHNFGFYQSTVYTMISCAVAFIFMSTVMLVAVCRFRMRRAPWVLQSFRPNQRSRFWHTSSQSGRRDVSDVRTNVPLPHLGQNEMSDPSENFVLLTFDSNTGFEIAEYGPKPPPYTENNIGIPPPPYSSVLDITAEFPNVGSTIVTDNVPTPDENNTAAAADQTPVIPLPHSTSQA